MAGRKLSFKKYLAIELKRLTKSDDFRLSSFCNNLTFTALPFAHIYAHYYSDLSLFEKTLNNPKYKSVILPELPDNYEEIESLKDNHLEYYKVLQGYNSYLDHNSAYSNLKKLYQNKFKERLSQINVPVYKLCLDADVSQGNLTMFLKGDLSKLSLDKCRRLNSLIS